jgi:hypothetical protein
MLCALNRFHEGCIRRTRGDKKQEQLQLQKQQHCRGEGDCLPTFANSRRMWATRVFFVCGRALESIIADTPIAS